MDFTFLPAEIVGSILSYLNIQSLLSFSSTSKQNQELAQHSLLKLDLAILPRQVHCNLALASQYCRDEIQGDIDPPQFGVGKTTNIPSTQNKESQSPDMIRQIQIRAQNQIAADILSQPCVSDLQSLSLHMYDIRSDELAKVIGQELPYIRNLELNFYHPFIHNPGTSSSYWRNASDGTPCWNHLVGLGSENQRHLRLRNLQSLTISRAGLTSAQLRKLVELNSGLTFLSLSNVTGVDLEFLDWLAKRTTEGKSRIRRLRLENCPKLVLHSVEDFTCISGLADGTIEHVSLQDCKNVREQIIIELAKESRDQGGRFQAFDTFILPSGRKIRQGTLDVVPRKTQEAKYAGRHNWTLGVIDVDPGYIVKPTIAVGG